MNPNHAILFLDRSKNEMIFWRMFPAASPFDFVIAQAIAKIASVQLVEHRAEIEVFALLPKV